MIRTSELKQIIKDKRIYFLLVSLFVSSCVVLAIALPRGDELVYFAGNRNPSRNALFLFITRFGEEIIYSGVIFISLFLSYRHFFGFALTGFLSLIISLLSKSFFLHPRPFTYFSTLDRIDLLGSIEAYPFHNAYNSFPSGHTLAAFGLFTLIALLGRNRLWQYLAFALASSVGVSRIYLGQHFVSDVGLGALLGTIIAFCCYYLLFVSLKAKTGLDGNLWKLLTAR